MAETTTHAGYSDWDSPEVPSKLEVRFTEHEVREFLDQVGYVIDMNSPEWLIRLVLDMKRFTRGE